VRKETSLFLLRFTIDRTDKYNYQICLMIIVNMTFRNWVPRTLSKDLSDLSFLWISGEFWRTHCNSFCWNFFSVFRFLGGKGFRNGRQLCGSRIQIMRKGSARKGQQMKCTNPWTPDPRDHFPCPGPL